MRRNRSLAVAELAEDVYLFAQHFGRALRAVDEELGLSAARFSVLGALSFHGSMHLGALAAFEGVKPPSMTRLVRDMESAGLVRRSADPDDGRAVRVEISARGRRIVASARARKIDLVAERLRGSPRPARAALRASLDLLQPLESDR